jgi:hypothetical protein
VDSDCCRGGAEENSLPTVSKSAMACQLRNEGLSGCASVFLTSHFLRFCKMNVVELCEARREQLLVETSWNRRGALRLGGTLPDDVVPWRGSDSRPNINPRLSQHSKFLSSLSKPEILSNSHSSSSKIPRANGVFGPLSATDHL